MPVEPFREKDHKTISFSSVLTLFFTKLRETHNISRKMDVGLFILWAGGLAREACRELFKTNLNKNKRFNTVKMLLSVGVSLNYLKLCYFKWCYKHCGNEFEFLG